MALDLTKPANSSPLVSAEIRANFVALAPMTAAGDTVYGDVSGVPTRLPKGTDGQVYTLVAGLPAWATPTSLTNPMSAVGDLIRGTTAGAPQRLAVGTNGQVLTVVSNVPAWATSPTMSNPLTTTGDMIYSSSGTTPARLAAVATGQVLASAGPSTAPAWTASPSLTTLTLSTNLLMGGGTVGTSGVEVFALGIGTAPTSSPTDTAQLYVADVSGAGTAGLHVRTETGQVTKFGAHTHQTAGTGTGFHRAVGVLYSAYLNVGTAANTTETTLGSYTLPANTLAVNGQSVRVRVWGTTAPNANTKRIKLKFGAAVPIDTTAVIANAVGWTYELLVMRSGAATQNTSGFYTDTSYLITSIGDGNTTETLSGTVLIALTGQNGTAAANDIILRGMLVEYLPES